MAERLTALPIAMLLPALLLAGTPAHGQPLADPMRPPSAAAAAPARTAVPELPASRLQSVLISPGRRMAVIDGRAVSLGERVGDATLVAINPAEVTLQRGIERQTLKLHAGAEKKTP